MFGVWYHSQVTLVTFKGQQLDFKICWNLWYAYAVMKVDLGLENAMFRKFNEIWSDIEKEAQIKLMDVDEDLKKELICFYTDILVK